MDFRVITLVFCGRNAYMVINLVIVDSETVFKLNDGSILNLFQKIGTWLSMSVVGPIVVLIVVLLLLLRIAIVFNPCHAE